MAAQFCKSQTLLFCPGVGAVKESDSWDSTRPTCPTVLYPAFWGRSWCTSQEKAHCGALPTSALDCSHGIIGSKAPWG